MLGSVCPASASTPDAGRQQQPARDRLPVRHRRLAHGGSRHVRPLRNRGQQRLRRVQPERQAPTPSPATLNLGYLTGSNGTYNLSGTGTLSTTGNENVGYSGSGTFNQTGGTNTASAAFTWGFSAPGTYNLSGTGALSVNNETIGYSSTGTFNQTGGTNAFAGQSTLLTIGDVAQGAAAPST